MLPTGQHTLTTQPEHGDVFKHCILVKLTESSTQAIEDFLRNKDNTDKRPSIVFGKDKGEICFPVSNASGFKKFHIAISSAKEAMKQDTSASVECVAFNDSKFKKLGTIESKMTVQAIKDEVFQATMEKVNNVKEEEKNNSTREIKHSGAIVNRSSLGNSSVNNNQNNSRAKQIAASIAASNNLKPKTPINDRPLRERIIHLLALKPYMKPEILLRLKKDNPLTDKEAEQLDQAIQSVGVLNHKNQYELMSDVMLNEVKEDWPFYNPQDKMLVKRNIANFKQKINNSTLNTSASKLNTSLNGSSKQFSSSSAFSSISSSSKSSLDDKKASPLKGNNLDNSYTGKTTPNLLKQRAQMQKCSISPDSPEDNNSFTSNRNNNSRFEKTESYPDFKRLKANGNISNQSHARDEATREQPFFDFSKKYKPVQSKQQLKQYTLEFDQNHKEYSDLYDFLAPTAKQFESYQKELEEIGDQNPEEAAKKKDLILRAYFDKKSDQDFNKRRERYDYLDMKLNFIKDLINQYKEKNEPSINLSPFSH